MTPIKVNKRNVHNYILDSCKYWSIKNKYKLIKLIIKFAIKEKLRFKGFY